MSCKVYFYSAKLSRDSCVAPEWSIASIPHCPDEKVRSRWRTHHDHDTWLHPSWSPWWWCVHRSVHSPLSRATIDVSIYLQIAWWDSLQEIRRGFWFGCLFYSPNQCRFKYLVLIRYWAINNQPFWTPYWVPVQMLLAPKQTSCQVSNPWKAG